MTRSLLIVLLGVVACGPLAPSRTSPNPPPVTPDSCAAMCAHLDALACPWASPTCAADCQGADDALREIGARGFDTSCITNAADCAAAKACP